jgi:hypothetical protein
MADWKKYGWTKDGIEARGYKEYPDSDVLKMNFFGLIRVYSRSYAVEIISSTITASYIFIA